MRSCCLIRAVPGLPNILQAFYKVISALENTKLPWNSIEKSLCWPELPICVQPILPQIGLRHVQDFQRLQNPSADLLCQQKCQKSTLAPPGQAAFTAYTKAYCYCTAWVSATWRGVAVDLAMTGSSASTGAAARSLAVARYGNADSELSKRGQAQACH